MDFFADTYYLFARLARFTLRMPVYLVMAIVQPILWVLLFSQLFRSVATLPGFGAGSYIQFLAPGIAIMTALFSAAYSGMGFLADIDRGVLDRMLATPVRRGALVAGRVVHAAAQVVVQALLILIVAIARGARPHGGILGLLALLAATALLGASLAAFSSALALLTRRQELVLAVMNFIVLPMVYLSTMLMAPGLMPGWMAGVARFNPVNWAVVAARAGFEGVMPWIVARDLLALLVFALLCNGFATAAFRKYRAEM